MSSPRLLAKLLLGGVLGCSVVPTVSAASEPAVLAELMQGLYRTQPHEHSPDRPQLSDRRVLVANPSLGAHVLYWQLNSGPEQRVYRQRLLVIDPDPASGLLRQRTWSLADPARFADRFDDAELFASLTAVDLVTDLPADCDPLWRRQDATWIGYVDPARCRIFSARHQDWRHIEAEMELTPTALYQSERGFDANGGQLFGSAPGEMLELLRVSDVNSAPAAAGNGQPGLEAGRD